MICVSEDQVFKVRSRRVELSGRPYGGRSDNSVRPPGLDPGMYPQTN